MSKDPWIDPDPQPGDFDELLAGIDPGDPRYAQRHEGDPKARLTFVVNVSGEDAKRLERIATQRGQGASEVIADLLREAERHAV